MLKDDELLQVNFIVPAEAEKCTAELQEETGTFVDYQGPESCTPGTTFMRKSKCLNMDKATEEDYGFSTIKQMHEQQAEDYNNVKCKYNRHLRKTHNHNL